MPIAPFTSFVFLTIEFRMACCLGHAKFVGFAIWRVTSFVFLTVEIAM
jgi:hypothetical protein